MSNSSVHAALFLTLFVVAGCAIAATAITAVVWAVQALQWLAAACWRQLREVRR